jgi:hypothetical protein
MSLQGPAWPRCVRRGQSLVAHLRRPCILNRLSTVPSWFATILILVILAASPASAKCRLFSVWHYPWPQMCVSASHRYVSASVPLPPERTTPNQERIEIPLPLLDNIIWGEVGPDELHGIALLRDLMSVPR